jgi:hypothetical protein
MDVKAAIERAKNVIVELFNDDGIGELNLEEVAFNKRKGEWLVVISFLRPLDSSGSGSAASYMAAIRPRQKKLVRFNATDGELIAVTNAIVGLSVAAA